MTVVLTAMNRFLNEDDGLQMAFLDGNQPDRLCEPMKQSILKDGGTLCWAYVGLMLGLCWAYVGLMLGACWAHVGLMLGLCWQLGASTLPPLPTALQV